MIRKPFVAGIAVFLFAAVTFSAASCRAQIGFTAYGGGILPIGEFSRTDISRAKSGAESGRSWGLGSAWRFRLGRGNARNPGLTSMLIVTFEYSKSEFGNDVPVSVFYDTKILDEIQIATPESRIETGGVSWLNLLDYPWLRLGLRFVPWGGRGFTPTFGIGIQWGRIWVNSWAFYGPGPQATELFEPQPLWSTLASGDILGSFLHTGLAIQTDHSALFFADIVYHYLFSESVPTTIVFLPSEFPPLQDKMKSNIQWWEIRGGLVFFYGD